MVLSTGLGLEPGEQRGPWGRGKLAGEGESEITPTGSPGSGPVGSEKVPWLLQGAYHLQPGLSTRPDTQARLCDSPGGN